MIEFLPPRQPGSEVTLDGFVVPRLEVSEDLATGRWHVTYDGRFGLVAEGLEELQRWIWIVANAQAVGEGYSCHGENSVYRPNPHRLQIRQVGTVTVAAMDTRAG